MIKKLSLLTLIAGTLMFSACGSSKDSKSITEKITDKNYVIILKKIATGICESTEYRNALKPNFTDALTSEESLSVTCATYGKSSKYCTEGDYAGATEATGNVACVIGYNKFIEKSSQKQNNTNMSDTNSLDIAQSAYIEVAE